MLGSKQYCIVMYSSVQICQIILRQILLLRYYGL